MLILGIISVSTVVSTGLSLTYAVSDLLSLTQRSSQFRIQGQDYHINIGGLYNIYNALAAVSVAGFFGVQPEVIKQGFDRSRAVFGRQETFKIGDKECTLVLIKNPVGATQAIEMIKLALIPLACRFLLNANYADGIDTSWIWDADFEQITQMDIPEINAGGCATLRLLGDFGSLAILQKRSQKWLN